MHVVIFLEGVPSSGKTSVARELFRRLEGVKVIDGDEEIRKIGRKRPRPATEIFESILEKIERYSHRHDLIVDMPLPATYLHDARTRFPDAFFVSLRLSEDDRISREARRRRKRPLIWNEEIAASQAPESDFNLVVDSSMNSATQCAEIILRAYGTEDV